MLRYFRWGNRWRNSGIGTRFKVRNYSTYTAYLRHQASKLRGLKKSPWLAEYHKLYAEAVYERIRETGLLKPNMVCLCLGARSGAEVRAFIKAGCFAVGIDIQPTPKNSYVLHGDFHKIQFPAHSVDIIFTNSLDHVYDIRRVIKEIQRVLKSEGGLVVEVMKKRDDGREQRFYESFSWASTDDLIRLFDDSGFMLLRRTAFTYPWSGEQLCFRKKEQGDV